MSDLEPPHGVMQDPNLSPITKRWISELYKQIEELRLMAGNFDLSVSRDLIKDHHQDQKFGSAPAGIQTTATTIWDRADSTPTQQLWTAPTQARVHALTSSDANDDDGDTGARTVRIWGLTSWTQDTYETYEDVTMNGTANVNTVNSYVIIYRMRVLTAGSSETNEGTITATAATDSTITAVILPGLGSTRMALTAVPDGWKIFMNEWTCGLDKASGAAASCRFRIHDIDYTSASNPVDNIRDEIAVQSTGVGSFTQFYKYPLRFTGPCIIEVRGVASSADLDGFSNFNYVRVPA